MMAEKNKWHKVGVCTVMMFFHLKIFFLILNWKIFKTKIILKKISSQNLKYPHQQYRNLIFIISLLKIHSSLSQFHTFISQSTTALYERIYARVINALQSINIANLQWVLHIIKISESESSGELKIYDVEAFFLLR